MAHTPLLQLAVDALSTKDASAIVEKVYPHMDIIEVGTPLLIEEGLAALEVLKKKHPDKKYLADLKIMDAGKIEATSAFVRGSDIVTVLAVADNATIQGALDAAAIHRGQIMADLINAPRMAERARELEQMGVPILCVHTGYDRQQGGAHPLKELEEVRRAVRCQVAVAGGLKLDSVGQAVSAGADIVVVGGGILNQRDPRAAAAAIMQKLSEQSQ